MRVVWARRVSGEETGPAGAASAGASPGEGRAGTRMAATPNIQPILLFGPSKTSSRRPSPSRSNAPLSDAWPELTKTTRDEPESGSKRTAKLG
ncbi:MAG: hypothetical protein IPP07_16190 [Holophagales bacterium]|nr:hypothetical protein [Holophagales bacterium]